MTYTVTCPIEGCHKLYQDWGGIRTKEEVERSFKAHLTGKHNLKGLAFQIAYKNAKRPATLDLNLTHRGSLRWKKRLKGDKRRGRR